MTPERLTYYFNKYNKVLQIYAVNIIRSWYHIPNGSGSDVVADAFVSIINIEDLHENKVRAYLYTKVKNDCLDLINKCRRMDKTRDMVSYLSEKSYEQSEMVKHDVYSGVIQELHAAIDKLPVVERMVFKMRYIDGMKPREVCSALNMKPGTFDTNIMRVKHKLREQFKGREVY